MIVALAGRRPDALGAPSRFPRDSVPVVRQRVRQILGECVPRTLVTSAACGADLIALDEALALNIHCRVILPCSEETFRRSSVVDLGAEWGDVYDRVLPRVELVRDRVLPTARGDDAHLITCRAILDEAARLGRETTSPVVAVVVWDGSPRPGVDITNEFRCDARARGWRIIEILTVV